MGNKWNILLVVLFTVVSLQACGEQNAAWTLTGAIETNSGRLARDFQTKCEYAGNALKSSSMQTEKDAYPTYYLTCTPKVPEK